MRRRDVRRYRKRMKDTSCQERAFDRLFKGMSIEEAVAEINAVWIDPRFKLVLVTEEKPAEEDELFKGWEVYSV